MKTFNLNFEGYFISKDDLPDYAGIYVVYTGTYNGNNAIKFDKLIYIGDATDINVRHQDHNLQSDFDNELKVGERLIYATCKVSNFDDRRRIQDALIYHIDPPLNKKSTKTFNYPDTILILEGNHAGIGDYIVAMQS